MGSDVSASCVASRATSSLGGLNWCHITTASKVIASSLATLSLRAVGLLSPEAAGVVTGGFGYVMVLVFLSCMLAEAYAVSGKLQVMVFCGIHFMIKLYEELSGEVDC